MVSIVRNVNAEFIPGEVEMVVFGKGYKIKDYLPITENLIVKVLPKELILRIFSYLDLLSLCRCACVSRIWNALATDGSIWQAIDLCKFQTDIDGNMLEGLAFKSGNFLRRLSLKGCKSITDGSFKYIPMSCHNLIMLNLSGCTKLGDSACQNIGLYCPRIQHLDLECCSNLTDLSLVSLSLGCEDLKCLNISWCLRITDNGLLHLLKKLHSLEVFNAKGCNQLSGQGLENISYCHQLMSLTLFGCERLADSTMMRITEGCGRLKLLCLSKCPRLTDVSLIAIAKNCPDLETLDLSGCSRLTDAGFVALTKNCHLLRRLDLEECILLGDSTVMNLALNCPRLSHLILSHCELLTDQSIAQLGTSPCAHETLSIIELDNCPLLTDNCLSYLFGCQNLRRIELIDCQLITPAGIHRLLCHLPGLKVHAYFTPATPVPSVGNEQHRKICKCCIIQ